MILLTFLTGEEDDAAAFEEMLNGQGARKTRLTKDPGITTRQLIRFFNPKLWNGYDSSSKVAHFFSTISLLTMSRVSTPFWVPYILD